MNIPAIEANEAVQYMFKNLLGRESQKHEVEHFSEIVLQGDGLRVLADQMLASKEFGSFKGAHKELRDPGDWMSLVVLGFTGFLDRCPSLKELRHFDALRAFLAFNSKFAGGNMIFSL